jgi:prepilin-type N-terminal cleavage/methylation domain-containing protein
MADITPWEKENYFKIMNMTKNLFICDKKAFTLIELLVVLGIIALLTTLSMVGVRIARDKAKVAKALHDIDQIHKAISMLATDSGQWPGHQAAEVSCGAGCAANNEICGLDANSVACANGLEDEISGIMVDDTGTPFSNWAGPYMRSIPLDPWNHEYFFDTDYNIQADGSPCNGSPGCVSVVVVGSYGPDGLGRPTGASPPAYGEDDIIKIIK